MIEETILVDFIKRGFSKTEIFELMFGLTDAQYRHTFKKVSNGDI